MLPAPASSGNRVMNNPSPTRFVQRLYGSLLLIALVLWCVVFLTFLPTLQNDFVNYDDDTYVVANVYVLAGLTLKNIAWAFTNVGAASNWHPITWLSHMLDCQLFGVRPWGHHLTSVMLHATNASLLFFVLNFMTGATARSFSAAALFGMHPLRVESVAWVAERKDLLGCLFFLLALGTYCHWSQRQTDRPTRKRLAPPREGY